MKNKTFKLYFSNFEHCWHLYLSSESQSKNLEWCAHISVRINERRNMTNDNIINLKLSYKQQR